MLRPPIQFGVGGAFQSAGVPQIGFLAGPTYLVTISPNGGMDKLDAELAARLDRVSKRRLRRGGWRRGRIRLSRPGTVRLRGSLRRPGSFRVILTGRFRPPGGPTLVRGVVRRVWR
jgi:hypothetical protein